MKQKLLALASALALCLSLAGCHFSTPDTVGTIGGETISSGLYLLAQFDAYQQAAQYAGEDQDPSSVKSFLKATITPDGGEAVTVSDYVAQTTLEELRRYVAVEDRFAELGAELDPAYTAQADSYTDQLIENYGDLYAANGIGEETIRSYEYNLAKQTALVDLLYGQEGETPITDEELTDHLQNQMLYIRYTTVPLYDLSTFAFADEDQTAQMLDLAKQAAADSTPDTFDQVVADALPGIYAVLGTEITAEEAADQLNSSFISLSEMEGSFSDEDTQTLTGLAFGQSAAVQYGGTSLLIAMRMDPLETMTLDTLRGTILSDMGTSLVEADMDAAGAALSADLDQGAMNKLPASKIKMSHAFWECSNMKTKYSTFQPGCATIEPSEHCINEWRQKQWQSNRQPGGISSAHSHPSSPSSTTTFCSAKCGAGKTSSPCGTAPW